MQHQKQNDKQTQSQINIESKLKKEQEILTEQDLHIKNKQLLDIYAQSNQRQPIYQKHQMATDYHDPIHDAINRLSTQKMQQIARKSQALSQYIMIQCDESHNSRKQQLIQLNSDRESQQFTQLKHKSSLKFSQALHLQVSVHKIFIELQETKVAVSYLQQLFLNQREILVVNHDQSLSQDELQIQLESQQKKKQSQQTNKKDAIVIKSQISKITQLKEISSDIQKYKKTLMLRESQLGSILVIIMKKHQLDFQRDYKSITDGLQDFMIPFDQTNQPINIFILDQVFQKEREYLKQYKQYVQSITKQFEQNKEKPGSSVLQKMKNKIQVLNAKIVTIAQIFPYACITPLTDLFSFKKTDKRWQNLFTKDVIEHKIYGARDKLTDSFDVLRANLNIINASMNIYNKNRKLSLLQIKDWGKIYQSASKVARIALFKGQAHEEAQLMISQGDNKLAKQIWNLPDQKILKDLVAASLPSIRYSEKMYIKRIFKQYLDDKGNIPIPKLVIDRVTSYGNELFNTKKYDQRLMLRINSSHMIRRIYDEDKEPEGYKFNFNALTSVFRKLDSHVPEQLIYHIHGGGFISMSTFVHQAYIRNWANSLEVPIISVQYGKAPEHPFPQGLYDCFEGYMWALYCFRQVFHVNPKRVILVGDSAGGNLVAALTTLLIQLKLQKPHGIVLVYPALNLNYKNYTPSLLTALNDMILPHTFLKVCLQQYLKDQLCRPKIDPHISPIVTPDQILKQYPPTKMFVGSMDPFHDDCCRFVERLNELCPGRAKLTIFQQFPHGFLQFDMKGQPHQYSRKATKQVQKALKELIQIPNEN